ncbi:SMI1/KNR4 family protein [Domibacillus sp. A3M-37]|uniref:SMI1/KNR4 family protein n=1 Tax=Domibacillus sp. A3M-37 TaxID=2962037 RepID=UPI0020B71C2E|nr:SMI1/KNR4 family protein [Domibacillus sp. A3M-37]MCP3762546.1 SMI1/KNR4 family protein [Domibacillus sp. A3M-37]
MKEHYNGKNFWDKEKSWRIEYPLTDDIIQKAEAMLDITFPETFKRLMKEQNGGELTYPYFMFPDRPEKYHLDIDPIHFEEDDVSIISSEDLLEEANLPKDLIILWWDFHHWLVMDYRFTKENPPIQYIQEDYSTEKMSWKYIKMADTFDDFLKQLFRIVD